MNRLLFAIAIGLVLPATGCEDEVMDPSEVPQPQQQKTAPSASSSAGANAPTKDGLPAVEFAEADFVESEESRDPFRDYTHMFVRKTTVDNIRQRKVKAEPFALDELKLVGIITRGRHSVMLTDPNGYGWVLYTGDFVGKAELVSAGGTDGTEVAINWRVDRIRNKDVVFIREDNAHPDIPPTTRIMPLYPAGEDT